MFIELHIIQNFPPSNLNRDDVGQPKDCYFGGFSARVSSQCLKRAIRYVGKDPMDKKAESIFERYTKVPLAERTEFIIKGLTRRLNEKRLGQEFNNNLLAKAFAKEYAGGIDDKDESKTKVLLYLSSQEQNRIVEKLDIKRDILLASLSPETSLHKVAKLFDERVNQRTIEPDKQKSIKSKDLTKEIQSQLENKSKDTKDAKSIAGEFKKLIRSNAKLFTEEELIWVITEIVNRWEDIQRERKAESALKPIVDEFIAETKRRTSAPDIALFGRMLADKPETNIDAACQVAHAISTHTITRNELDYFTAVDELKDPKEETGAGFLDVSYFNSACFYRYARIDFEQLKKNLGNDEVAVKLSCDTVEAFLRASEAAIPTGKKNSYAQECRPSFLLAVVRSNDSSGWSLVNAFEKPVNAKSENGLIEGSIKRLDNFYNHLERFYGKDSVSTLAVALPSEVVSQESLSERLQGAVKPSFNDWVNAICKPLRKGA